MSRYTVLLDANILYSAPMRDVLLQLAVTDLFKAKWTADIHREWIEALLRNEPHRNRAALERTRDMMDRATRDCLVTGYESLIPSLTLPDPDDRHVLAAAIVGKCDVILKIKMTTKAGVNVVFFLLVASETKGLQVADIVCTTTCKGDDMVDGKISF